MPVQVEVALIGDPERPLKGGVLDQSYFDMPYSQRRRVRFEANEDESLASVMERAARVMGLRPPDWKGGQVYGRGNRIAFYKPEDEVGFAPRAAPRLLAGELTLIDRDGRAIFGVWDHRAVRLVDLMRASEAGVLEGDPLRPYLMLDFGWGDAPPPDWATIQQGLEVVWQVLQAVGVVGGAVTAIGKAREWLAERVDRARDALSAHPEWMQRGYRPDQFRVLVASREWTADQLAPLLGCSEQEAEAVLWALGYSFSPESKRWEQVGDEVAQMITDILTAIGWVEKGGAGWEASFRNWLLRYLETGRRPPFEQLRPSFDDEEYEYKPSLGERLDDFLTRLRHRQ